MNREKIIRVRMIKTSDMEYTAEKYIEFIESGRKDKLSQHGLNTIAAEYRQMQSKLQTPTTIASNEKQPRAKKKDLRLFSVSGWAYLYDNASPLMIGFITAMLLNTTYKLIETIIIKITLIVNGG